MDSQSVAGKQDIELIELCKKGHSAAQMEIYRRYYKAMYNTSLRILNHPAEAEDAMQESFLKAFQSIGKFENRSGFGHWLKQIVVRTSIDLLRKHRMVLEPIEETKLNIPSEIEPDYEEMRGRVEEIRKAIQNLPDGYRVVLSLHLLEGFDHDEIAQVLGISNSSSRSQYSRAKRKLLEDLKKTTRHENT